MFDKKEFIFTEAYGKKLLLPTPQLLLAMKITSLPERDKEHKRIKDLCDIFALTWYTNIDIHATTVQQFVPRASISKCLKIITDEDYRKAGSHIGHTARELQRVIENVLS